MTAAEISAQLAPKMSKNGPKIARARGRGPNLIKKAGKLLEKLGDRELNGAVTVWREGLGAVFERYDAKTREWTTSPDWRTRIDCANIIVAYMEGRPVERSIQATGKLEDFDAILSRLRDCPTAREDPLMRAKLLPAPQSP